MKKSFRFPAPKPIPYFRDSRETRGLNITLPDLPDPNPNNLDIPYAEYDRIADDIVKKADIRRLV